MKKNTPEYQEMAAFFKRYNTCPIVETMKFIGGKWKPTILYLIRGGINRFGEIRQIIPEISKKVLTEQLRELERDGLIDREVFAEVPPRVEYSLTEFGKTLTPVLKGMCNWSIEHVLD